MEKPAPLKPVSAARTAARPLPKQLEAVRERSSKTLVRILRTFLDSIDDKLFDLSESASSDSERRQLLDAMRELRIQRGSVETRFQQELMNCYQALVRDDKSEAGKKADAPTLETLSLVNDDELEANVAIDAMARKVRNSCEEQLGTFNHRVGYLFEGRIDIDEFNGPLEPRQIAKSMQKAMESLQIDIRTRLVLLKLFERDVLAETEEVVADANQQLVDAGVLPELKTVPVKKRSPAKTAGAAGGDRAAAPESTNQMFGMLQEMLATMRSMMGAAQGGGGGGGGGGGVASGLVPAAGPANMAVMQNGVAYVGGAPVTAGTAVHAVSSDDLLGMLNRLQRVEQSLDSTTADGQLAEVNVKEELSGLLEAGHEGEMHALEQADDDVINLVSMLFDFILDDQALPTAIKALIGRLQIPLLKVAITDKSFFANDSHPARLLLNALARAGTQWSPAQGSDDALYKLVESSVFRILDDYDLDASLFDELLEQVNAQVDRQAQQSERVEARVREMEEGRAQSELAARQVDKELDKRLAGRSLPEIAEKVLRQAWRQVLVLTFLREGDASEGWAKQLKVADAVVWSLLPHTDEAEKERLRGLSPRLLTSLDQGLLAINYDAVERQSLVAMLRQAHLQALQGGASLPQKVVAPVVVEVQPVSTLPANSPLIKKMGELVAGQWLELGAPEQASRCKLAANIRQGTKLVFTNQRGVKVAEFSAIELAEKIHQREARLLESGDLFERALQSVIGDLRRQAH